MSSRVEVARRVQAVHPAQTTLVLGPPHYGCGKGAISPQGLQLFSEGCLPLFLVQTLTLGWYIIGIGLSMAQFLCLLFLFSFLLLRLAV